MKALQWTMTIPEEKQKVFVKWFKDVAGPTFSRFGAKKHELYKVADNQVIGKQLAEKNRFVERVYFEDSFEIADYFVKVKADSQAWKTSRMYEGEFGATDIELRIIYGVCEG